jgi:Domain of unknown function (DUF4350)
MRQKFVIFISVIFLLALLIGLNAASYVKKEKTPDTEANPNRSTYNTGATGTRAFYDLLAETGRTVTRWQESTSALSVNDKNQPDVFVVIGETRREFTEAEIESLLRWVSAGGKLVVIDREPPSELIKTTANWSVSAESEFALTVSADPLDVKQMTDKTPAAKPSQPTIYTNKVNAVQPSRFASSISFERSNESDNKAKVVDRIQSSPSPKANFYLQVPPPPPPPPLPAPSGYGTGEGSGSANDKPAGKIAAPFAHLANETKTLLADFPYGSGKIVFLSDPYIVSNGGISLVDNAQLAINIVASGGGIIAFDEFHQGYGAGQNRLFDYFAGTPLTAVLLHLAALVGFILFTQSRRFARPLPENEPNRLSKLEYVAAMAELQQRTKAFDLAMENIYKDFRRRVSRLVGADALKTPRSDLAALIAERAKLNRAEVETLLEKCENIMHGEPTNKKEMLNLTGNLREVEGKLGLKRNVRQTFKR